MVTYRGADGDYVAEFIHGDCRLAVFFSPRHPWRDSGWLFVARGTCALGERLTMAHGGPTSVLLGGFGRYVVALCRAWAAKAGGGGKGDG